MAREMVSDLTNGAVKRNVEGVARSSMAREMVSDLTNGAVKRNVNGLVKACVTDFIDVEEIAEKGSCICNKELSGLDDASVPVSGTIKTDVDDLVHQSQANEENFESHAEFNSLPRIPLELNDEVAVGLVVDDSDYVKEEIEVDPFTGKEGFASDLEIKVAAPPMGVLKFEMDDINRIGERETEIFTPIAKTVGMDMTPKEVDAVIEALITRMIEKELSQEVQIVVDALVFKVVETEKLLELDPNLETIVTETFAEEEQKQLTTTLLQASTADVSDTNVQINDIQSNVKVEFESTSYELMSDERATNQEIEIDVPSKDAALSFRKQDVSQVHTVVTKAVLTKQSERHLESQEIAEGQQAEKKIGMKLNIEIEANTEADTDTPISNYETLVPTPSVAPIRTRRSKRIAVDPNSSQKDNDWKNEKEVEEIRKPSKRTRQTRSSSQKQISCENDENENTFIAIEIETRVKGNYKKECSGKKTSSKPPGKKKETGKEREGKETTPTSSKCKATGRRGLSKRQVLGTIEHDVNIVEEGIHSSQPTVRRSARIRSK